MQIDPDVIKEAVADADAPRAKPGRKPAKQQETEQPLIDAAPIAPPMPAPVQSGKRVLAIYANGYRATMDKLDAIEMMRHGAVTNYLEDF
jgi:hypothetical protein